MCFLHKPVNINLLNMLTQISVNHIFSLFQSYLFMNKKFKYTFLHLMMSLIPKKLKNGQRNQWLLNAIACVM